MNRSDSIAGVAWRWLLIVGFAIIAAVNLPGQAPLDSVTALWEGRHHLSMSWGPRMYSAILGVFDAIVPGMGLFAVCNMALLALAWLALPRLRPRLAWTGPLVLVFWLATPQLLLWQGVVLRDVLFANLTVAAFVALALAARFWSTPTLRWPLLVLTVASLALGALVRQNGGVVIVPAALALGWIAAQGRIGRGLAWAAAGLAAPLLLAAALDAVNPVRKAPDMTRPVGLEILAHYDLLAALAEDPGRPLPLLAASQPDKLPILRSEARGLYSPSRIDTIDRSPTLGVALWGFEPPVMLAQWRSLIASDPVGYVRRRLEVFRWVFLTPELGACAPLHLGVGGLPQIVKELGLVEGLGPEEPRLYAYGQRWFATPTYSHLTYALLAAIVAGVLLLRRSPPDIAMAGLMVGALGFAGTFLFVSIACDYRYLYALDLAAVTGVLYLAIDPSLRRSGAGKAASSAERTSA